LNLVNDFFKDREEMGCQDIPHPKKTIFLQDGVGDFETISSLRKRAFFLSRYL